MINYIQNTNNCEYHAHTKFMVQVYILLMAAYYKNNTDICNIENTNRGHSDMFSVDINLEFYTLMIVIRNVICFEQGVDSCVGTLRSFT